MYAVSHNDYDEKIEIERSGDWHFGGPIDEILYRAILIRGGSSMLMRKGSGNGICRSSREYFGNNKIKLA